MKLNHLCMAVMAATTVLITPSCKTETKQERQDRLFKQDSKQVLAEVEEMTQADQDLRNMEIYGTTDTAAIDRLEHQAEAKGGSSYDFVIKEITSQHFRDSIRTISGPLSDKSADRMIAIIEKYGYPSSARTGDSQHYINPIIILHHADPSTYKDKILPIILYELQLGRIDSNTYEDLKWHLNGRVGIPNLRGVTIVKIDSATGKIDTIRR